jgi:MFS family permease
VPVHHVATAHATHRLRRTVRSLRHRDYRLFLAGHAISIIGTWMQRVAQDWLVLEISDSGVALGVATALQFLPTLVLGLWGGVLVDRLDRRRTLIATQATSAVLAGALGVVTLTGVVTLWMVYALALGLGLVTVVDNPARQALVTEKVPPEDFVNAQALNSTVHNTGRLLGPALAGVVIALGGVGTAFLVNALSFAAVLVSLVRMAPGARAAQSGYRSTHALGEGLRYVLARPDMTAALMLVTVMGLFGQNFRVVLPLLAQNDLHTGATGYSALTSALGLGAIVGALITASRVDSGLGALTVWTVAFGVANALAAIAPTSTLVLITMVGVGIGNITFNTLARTLLQLRAEPRMQGRVIALHGMAFLGTTPFGAPLLGWWCTRYGARAGLGLAAAAAFISAAAVLPVIRRQRASSAPAARS